MRKFPSDSVVNAVHGLELPPADQGPDDFPELAVETVRGDKLLANAIGVARTVLATGF